MPEYRFENKGGKENGKLPNSPSRTRQIPVESGDIIFHIGTKSEIPTQETDLKSEQKSETKEIKNSVNIPSNWNKISTNSSSTEHEKTFTKSNISGFKRRIWNGLEFVAITALIFTLLFFVINFDSYSHLLTSKFEQLSGNTHNPYTEQELEQMRNASKEGQNPLPIVDNIKAAKKQIPELSMVIAPPDDRILIPRIGQNVPIIRVSADKLIRKDWAALENQIQEALRYGVVHFPGTALPGDKGNVVITGHSSYFPWDSGRFKDVFALLHQVSVGDKVIVYRDQVPYEYEVYEKKIVAPNQVEVLTQKGEDRLTLITCTPIGTNLKRLVVLARPI